MVRGDQMHVRYLVSSHPTVAERLENAYVRWNPISLTETLSVCAIGIDEDRYRQLMNQE